MIEQLSAIVEFREEVDANPSVQDILACLKASYLSKYDVMKSQVLSLKQLKGWQSDASETSGSSKPFIWKEYKAAMHGNSDYDCRCILADFHAENIYNPRVGINPAAIPELMNNHFKDEHGNYTMPSSNPHTFYVVVPENVARGLCFHHWKNCAASTKLF